MALELEGISTASWKEFETEWKVTLGERAGLRSFSTTTNLAVRAENCPTAFLLKLGLPRSAALSERVLVEGTVERMSGAYHGHGIWFKLAKEK